MAVSPACHYLVTILARACHVMPNGSSHDGISN